MKKALAAVLCLVLLTPSPIYAVTLTEAQNELGNQAGFLAENAGGRPYTDTEQAAALVGEMDAYKADFADAAAQYSVDFTVLATIAAIETGYFTSEVFRAYNNVGGMCGGDGYLAYDTPREGIFALARLLREEYLNEDGAYYNGPAVIDIAQRYNSSMHWAGLYCAVRAEMETRLEEARAHDRETESKKANLKKFTKARRRACAAARLAAQRRRLAARCRTDAKRAVRALGQINRP